MRDLDVGAVSELIRRVAREEILPRFAALHELESTAKPSPEDPDDIVTSADLAAERILATELTAMLPGSVAVGEEATAKDASVRDVLDDAALAWLIDPLDGTKNFAAGNRDFGSMVCLCAHGDAVASWIHHPLSGRTFVAQRGAGAWEGERRIRTDGASPERPSGTVYSRFMPREVAEAAVAAAARTTEAVDGRGAAAFEYADLVDGLKDFNLYWRLLPWDHAPGALLLTEAGGALRHPDGRPYRAADRDPFALAARVESEWERIRELLLPR